MKQSSIETKMIFNPKLEHLQHGGWKFKPLTSRMIIHTN